MDKFQPASYIIPSIKKLKRDMGLKKPQAIELIEKMKGRKCWLNDTYQVEENRIGPPMPGWPDMIWLSIKRRDKEPIHDWRELQEIKNQLVGPECEAVELYPAEKRVIDTANQYHLWCLADPGFMFPFGMTTDGGPDRSGPERIKKMGGKQRPFNERGDK